MKSGGKTMDNKLIYNVNDYKHYYLLYRFKLLLDATNSYKQTNKKFNKSTQSFWVNP